MIPGFGSQYTPIVYREQFATRRVLSGQTDKA
jgi:hypothetical protein